MHIGTARRSPSSSRSASWFVCLISGLLVLIGGEILTAIPSSLGNQDSNWADLDKIYIYIYVGYIDTKGFVWLLVYGVFRVETRYPV